MCHLPEDTVKKMLSDKTEIIRRLEIENAALKNDLLGWGQKYAELLKTVEGKEWHESRKTRRWSL